MPKSTPSKRRASVGQASGKRRASVGQASGKRRASDTVTFEIDSDGKSTWPSITGAKKKAPRKDASQAAFSILEPVTGAKLKG